LGQSLITASYQTERMEPSALITSQHSSPL
jgi:hypothetical protein